MKKKISLILVVVMVLSCLAACGQAKTPAAESTVAPAETVAEGTAAPETETEPVVSGDVELASHFAPGSEQAAVLQGIADAFMAEHPEINVTIQFNGNENFVKIRIEENDGLLMFYKADTGELIHKCRKSAEEGGDIPYKDDAIDMETVGENAMRRVFDDVEDVESFIAMLREQNGRYANSQMNKIVSLAKVYTVDQVESAILYCIRVKKCSLNEVQAYLLYRYGLGMAKRKMTENTFYHCKKRAEEIAEEQNGRLD